MPAKFTTRITWGITWENPHGNPQLHMGMYLLTLVIPIIPIFPKAISSLRSQSLPMLFLTFWWERFCAAKVAWIGKHAPAPETSPRLPHSLRSLAAAKKAALPRPSTSITTSRWCLTPGSSRAVNHRPRARECSAGHPSGADR